MRFVFGRLGVDSRLEIVHYGITYQRSFSQMFTGRNAVLYLLVDHRFLRLFPAAGSISLPVPPSAGTTGIFNVIIVNLENLQPCS